MSTKELVFKWQFRTLGLVKLCFIYLAWHWYDIGAAAIAVFTWIELSFVSKG